MNETCHTHECITAYARMRDGPPIKWDMSHTWRITAHVHMSDDWVTDCSFVNEKRHTYTSATCMRDAIHSYVTCMCDGIHLYVARMCDGIHSYVTCMCDGIHSYVTFIHGWNDVTHMPQRHVCVTAFIHMWHVFVTAFIHMWHVFVTAFIHMWHVCVTAFTHMWHHLNVTIYI